jgi:hypothetical protein
MTIIRRTENISTVSSRASPAAPAILKQGPKARSEHRVRQSVMGPTSAISEFASR